MINRCFNFVLAKLDVLIIATLYIKHLTKLTQMPLEEEAEAPDQTQESLGAVGGPGKTFPSERGGGVA